MENLRSKGQSVPEGATSEALFGVGTVLYADNVVQLKANIGSATRPIAVLAGYNAIGDGGGGVFYWNTSAALVDEHRVEGRVVEYPENVAGSFASESPAQRPEVGDRVGDATGAVAPLVTDLVP